MTWRQAFFRQARSENGVRRRLDTPETAYSHRLHYLQMVTEKLAKGFASNASDLDTPVTTHLGFVTLLQSLKGNPDLRLYLGYRDARSFRAFMNSLLPLARRIEQLAPSIAGQTQPNPEYPWRDPASRSIHAPVDHSFEIFDPADPKMIKLERLIEALFRIAK